MTTLHIICGVPGSGKSTLAKKLESDFEALRLTPDEWMERIVMDGYDENRRAVVEKIQCEIAEQVLKRGMDVILENGFWTRAEREAMKEMAQKVNADIRIYAFDVSREELRRRLEKRNQEKPPHTFYIDETRLDEALKHFEAPTMDEGNVTILK